MASKAKMFKWSKDITPSQVIKLMRAEKDVEKLISVFDSATAEYANGFLHDQSSFSYMVSRLVSANKFKAAHIFECPSACTVWLGHWQTAGLVHFGRLV
ncbi:hypothetical protein F2Q70_00031449 [Brassica cretica]|uniref:Uncharacterized protein n=1 Tax=Brassica cretica TaxID=69181 RepID=A0A8S9FHR0_BRACR|nr:hypothetical protein F2Q70_00031449 [Brassica cretica]